MESERMSYDIFQGFSTTESHNNQPDCVGYLPGGDHHQPDNGSFDRVISPPRSRNSVVINTTNPSNPRDNPLELEFGRLSLSAPPFSPALMGAPPALDGAAARIGGVDGGSNIWNYPPVNMSCGHDFSFEHPPFYNGGIQKTRVQSAAMRRMGLYGQPQNYSPLDDDNGNGFPAVDWGSGFNSRRSLNEATTEYQHNAYHSSDEMLFGNYGDVQYRNGIGSRNIAAFISDWHNDYDSLHRSRHHPIPVASLKDLRGRIFLDAKDKSVCSFLQNKLKEGNPEEILMIFWELKDHICELMVDQFGNGLIQKLFEVCNEEQIYQLFLLVISDGRRFKYICADNHGSRVVQKLLEYFRTPEQRSLVISVLRRNAVALTKSRNGYHVLQHCFKLFPSDDSKQILTVIADNCLKIAMDKSGCCVLQSCVPYAYGETRQRLIAEITSNAVILSENRYGNYVVQYILGLGIPLLTANIIAQLRGSYVSLSMNKYGSNVVEKCLIASKGDQLIQIINEIIHSRDFLMVLQDPYGNYVAQKIVSTSKGAIRDAIVRLILHDYASLHSHPQGKRVLARLKSIG